mmetsp:Transcript_8695/g.12681  ORF Transcript_8695/g.12681 Transcript_8695/m.12681 type:complete len:768 (+) Transcript_8695:170-2473(+)|eukprot:CAMPEP_0172419028 /NCGR_PEP_ID=MMETSP1064-20121228/5463_1 /TAXON_ID=202472 /ORGANISM="Aulacoseira subarctica , Strain CCAP 1002/5" /LENGTH=767 /DNA_ID=CAMNT_0013158267 /DNA_START=136 /DNA_END=2439 /DNA_ORIENTATION=+
MEPASGNAVMPPLLLPKDPTRILNVNVGVLGHVDSGKTSLVKRLSTLLSTAALDKHPQSRERGITLDLGFSAFFMEPPPSLIQEYDCVQITLVDCPGHSSLIRTIIGGAQIIDMILLVVDATKGIQAQTTECLVLAEITTDKLIVVLNKIDLFSATDINSRTRQIMKTIRTHTLANTKFRDAPMVAIAAAVGGEKVAAVTSVNAENCRLQSTNVEELVHVLQSNITLPRRDTDTSNTTIKSFHFAIDHCFPIKGKGTVLTGTVVSGRAQVNDIIYFPEHNMERKIKSLQMFKRPTTSVRQGDRCGICVASLDSTLIERGIASKPHGFISYIESAVCLVQKVRFFNSPILTDSKFHMSVGHSTVMATVKFFGAKELLVSKEQTSLPYTKTTSSTETSSLTFDFDQDYIYQDRLIDILSIKEKNKLFPEDSRASNDETLAPDDLVKNDFCSGVPLLHWAIVHFHTPVYCPLNSLVIGSRLDTDVNISSDANVSSNNNNTCRLAFHGRIVQKFDPKTDVASLKIYNWKEKKGTIYRLGDAYRRDFDQQIVRFEAYGGDLFKKETKMSQFVGMKVESGEDIGVIRSSFGTEGKFKVFFPAGTTAKEGSELRLRFKRYTNDPKKGMHQDIKLPDALSGVKIEIVKKSKVRKEKKKISSSSETTITNATAADMVTPLRKEMTLLSTSSTVYGEISKYKLDSILPDGKNYSVAIVEGLFTPDINIKEKIGVKVTVVETKEEGLVSGSFGKMGKCKVTFENGTSVLPGSKVYIHE